MISTNATYIVYVRAYVEDRLYGTYVRISMGLFCIEGNFSV